jgi:hypothetical protein
VRLVATRYVLVFQFEDTYFDSAAALVAFEERLRAALPRTSAVNGHEVGSGTTNFFVLTPSPVAAHARFRRRTATRAIERKLRDPRPRRLTRIHSRAVDEDTLGHRLTV